VIVAIFLRRLKPDKTFEDFERAWEAEQGFGMPARVLTAVALSDPREVLTIGFVDLEPADLEAGFAKAAGQEHIRHERIAEVIESTELREFYELRGEHDFSGEPLELEPGSAGSILAGLSHAGGLGASGPG
jgi:hypothetical protein